ncbi:MAG: hypothetical protein HGB01_04405 [Chlorobiaceae bacterium]|nr:hypothetical protein [Chlorobiales bacterium]NTU91869.1 hypothetical protein [Chlorobiaceae bacterium]NTV25434.1 hypothetical protein [Chlorobiaceae bacterium]
MNANGYLTQDMISILKEADEGMQLPDLHRLEELEEENERLRKLAASQARDIRMLRQLTLANW